MPLSHRFSGLQVRHVQGREGCYAFRVEGEVVEMIEVAACRATLPRDAAFATRRSTPPLPRYAPSPRHVTPRSLRECRVAVSKIFAVDARGARYARGRVAAVAAVHASVSERAGMASAAEA